MKIEWQREIMKDPEKRGNVLFAAFYRILEGFLMLSAAFILVERIDTFHATRGAVAMLILFLTMLGTITATLAVFGLLGWTALIFTVVENK